jgi:hypothetical protein
MPSRPYRHCFKAWTSRRCLGFSGASAVSAAGGSRLNDGVDSGTEIWIAKGLATLSMSPEELERKLKLSTMRWSSFPARETIALLEEVQDRLRGMGPKAGTLAEVVRRVLDDAPEDPRAREAVR